MSTNHLPSSSITERPRDSIAVVKGGVCAMSDSRWKSGTRLRSQTIHPVRDRANLAAQLTFALKQTPRRRALVEMKLASSAVFKVQIAAEVPA